MTFSDGTRINNHRNHLANETSPYLLQHANNPVDWYPWSREALEKAKKEDKPILLSIGYSACHWCHVMERESFEDSATAAIMNELFVCIKVDREERPDIDQIYMKFVQMTTGSGGWPLNVFLTPDQEPFFGGTYFPPDDRYGRMPWTKVLRSVHRFYQENKNQLTDNIEVIKQEYAKETEVSRDHQIAGDTTLKISVEKLAALYDPHHGGLGTAPKFPAVYPLAAFLRYYQISKDQKYLDMTVQSLRKMADGGIYDHLGGGFARYAVDEKWLVPHFEKMLYDNAQLAPLYLDTYLLTGDTHFLKIAEETLSFVKRELLSPEGGFYSSLDADSEGVEGKYYVWEKSEIEQILGNEDSKMFCYFYGVTDHGNFEHKNILNIHSDLRSAATRFGKTAAEFTTILESSRNLLLKHRNERVRPGLDEKILTSWNGLMLSAFARAYQVTGRNEYATVIENNIRFLQNKLYNGTHLWRTYSKGLSKYQGYLDDYAFLIQGLLDAYEALFDPAYLEWAHKMLFYTNEKFWDAREGGYFYSSSEQEELFARMKDVSDQSIPSAISIMILNNLRFFSLTENKQLLGYAEDSLGKYSQLISVNPYGYASYLMGLEFYLKKPKEIVLVIPENLNAADFKKSIFNTYYPNKVVIKADQDRNNPALAAALLQNKSAIDGKVTAYVCHNFVCGPPIVSPEDFQNILN